MPNPKPLFNWLIVIAVTAVTIVLNVWFFNRGLTTGRNLQLNLFSVSWVLNFTLFIWVSVAESLLKPPLTSPYFDSFKFEKKGRFYTKLGVNWFRKFLVLIGWEKLTRANAPVKNDIAALEKYERATRKSEFGHGIAAIIDMILTVYIYTRFGFAGTYWMIALNILLNGYPIMLQRYNRPRLRTILKRHFQANRLVV